MKSSYRLERMDAERADRTDGSHGRLPYGLTVIFQLFTQQGKQAGLVKVD